VVSAGHLFQHLGAVCAEAALQDGVNEAESVGSLGLGELGYHITVSEVPGIPARGQQERPSQDNVALGVQPDRIYIPERFLGKA
jgi:hypothetical protein